MEEHALVWSTHWAENFGICSQKMTAKIEFPPSILKMIEKWIAEIASNKIWAENIMRYDIIHKVLNEVLL